MNDEVLFTQQWATVATILHREIGRSLKDTFGVTYLMFCLLASLRSHGGSMILADFPRGTLANDNTVVVAANKAARLGLLEKHRCEDDRRVVRITGTTAGEAVVDQGFEAIYDRLRATVWRNHEQADIEQTMLSFPGVVSRLGIASVEINHWCHPVLTPSYLMCVAGFLRHWEACTFRFAGLPFVQYRCLALLEHRLGSLTCATIAEELMLDRSSVSPHVAHLAAGAYVKVEVGGDRRSRRVSLTDKGRVVAALVTAELETITAELFADASPSVKAKANELHMRMYASYIA